MSNIKSITPIGKHQTYDLEVDHADHQFYLANGVLTSNSHAVAYAIDSFWCAWLITYYEEQWLSAYLEAMSGTPLKRATAFGEVRALGYQIVPIDINHATSAWTVLPGKKLMPSMSSVKGIGDAAVEEIVALRPFSSIENMLYDEEGCWRLSKFNRRALESLIKIKAFESLDCIGPGKVFGNYQHMYETIMGSYTETVTRKRKGVEETVEVERDHFDLIKKSTNKDPLEGRKNFYNLARGLAAIYPEEWSHRQLLDFQVESFGTADVTLMFDASIFKKLDDKNIIPIEDLEVGETGIVWFTTINASGKKGEASTSGVKKQTRNGKEYVQAYVTGTIGKMVRLSIWGCTELFDPFKLCISEVERNEYGYSTTKWKVKVIA